MQLYRLQPKPVYLLYIWVLEMAFPPVSNADITHADLLDIYWPHDTFFWQLCSSCVKFLEILKSQNNFENDKQKPLMDPILKNIID